MAMKAPRLFLYIAALFCAVMLIVGPFYHEAAVAQGGIQPVCTTDAYGNTHCEVPVNAPLADLLGGSLGDYVNVHVGTGLSLSGSSHDATRTLSAANSGTVLSVGLGVPASSLFGVTGSPVTTSGTLGLTTTGNGGGVPYFDSSTTIISSAALTALVPVLGGGINGSPTSGSRTGTTTAFVTYTTTPSGTETCAEIDGNLDAANTTFPCALFTSTTSGFVPLSGGGTTNYLRADGTWNNPTAGGGCTVPGNGSVVYVVGGGCAGDPTNFGWSDSSPTHLTVIGNPADEFKGVAVHFVGGDSNQYGAAWFCEHTNCWTTTNTGASGHIAVGYGDDVRPQAETDCAILTGSTLSACDLSLQAHSGLGGRVSIGQDGFLGQLAIRNHGGNNTWNTSWFDNGGSQIGGLFEDTSNSLGMSLFLCADSIGCSGNNPVVYLSGGGNRGFIRSNIYLGGGTLGVALATTATDPFPFIPTMAGTPTGTPTFAAAGQAALIIDTTNHKLCWYEQVNSAWKCAAGL
jgi:hypothetical protein